MAKEDVFSHYIRFLKDNKIYKPTMAKYVKHIKSLIKIKSYLETHLDPTAWMTDVHVFGFWNHQIEGFIFWQYYSLLWEAECIRCGYVKTTEFRLLKIISSVNYLIGRYNNDSENHEIIKIEKLNEILSFARGTYRYICRCLRKK